LRGNVRAATLGALVAGLAVGTLAGASPASADEPTDAVPTPAPIDAPPIRSGHHQGPEAGDALPAPSGPDRPDPDRASSVPADLPPVRSGRTTDLVGPPVTGPVTGPPTGRAPAAPSVSTSSAATPTSSPESSPAPSGSVSTVDPGRQDTRPTAGSVDAGTPALVEGARYTVLPGDNLWDLAAARLAARPASPSATVPEIAAYWVRVCLANRPTLRSGNPGVIYPGETVELPAP
jgi:hypothetical protein